MMKAYARRLLLIDAMLNYLLGLILLSYSDPVVRFLGLPQADHRFYPTILGAVLLGIGMALSIEYATKGHLAGLGLGGAISINLMGGLVLLIWLISGSLPVPWHGRLLLGLLDVTLIGLSLVEGIAFWRGR